ncbi:MAG TPA: DUF928 domain-containing protein [Candidatus Obscuribacterales bacterium]
MKRYLTHRHRLCPRPWRASLGSALTLVLLLTGVSPARANFINTVRGIFTGDTGSGARGNTRGGAIRDEYCYRNPGNAIAPAPESPLGQMVVLAPDALQTTTQAQPEFFLYLPFAATLPQGDRPTPAQTQPQSQPATIDIEELDTLLDIDVTTQANLVFEFELWDAATRAVVGRVNLDLPPTAGLVKFQLPAEMALAVDQTYLWNFRLVCQRVAPVGLAANGDTLQTETEVQVVFGEIQRVAANPALTTALTDTSPAEVYIVYLEQGIWFDMVAALAQQPEAPDWRDLLAAWEIPTVDPMPHPLQPLTTAQQPF